MSKTIDRIRAKVTRAKQHLQDFQLGLDAFYKTDPYRVGIKEDTQTGKRIYLVTKADCVPDALTAIAADVLHNLRTPLDHLAYQFVLESRGGTKPDWLVYYPICATAADYPSVRTKVKGVRQEVIDAIDATEPYRDGKGHALWQLNSLHKPDKHELLVGAASIMFGNGGLDIAPMFKDMFANMGMILPIPPIWINPAEPSDMKVGDVVFVESIHLKVQEQRHFPCHVAFNDSGVTKGEPAVKTLQDMTNLVDDIITTLGKFLP